MVGLCSLWVPLRSLSIHAGSLSQLLGFTLTVPQSVSVQEGLCVLVPCNFKYPASYDTKNSPARLYRYWYKDPADVGRNPPVASSDPSRLVTQETQGRFRLAENPARGDCSVQISDARQTDAGRYFLRVEGDFKYTYRTSADGTDLTLTISVPGTLLAGEPVTVTCTAPGRCSGTPPRVTWMGPFSDTARNVSAQLANGTWAHSSALSFTPTPGKHGKELVCSVTYRPPWGPSTSKTVQLHVVYPSAGIPTLGCEASSRPEATLSWAKGNESLSPGQGGAGHLELPNLSRGDAGEYRCWAKNSYGSASRALRVHVQSKVTPEITVSRANRSDPQLFQGTLTAREGDSLRFLCSVASSPPTALCWVRGGRAVEGAHPAGENQLRLELPNVTAKDGGLYGCWAKNMESSAQGTFQLLNSSCQHQGPNISCSCSLRSHPPPRLQWQVDGEPLAGNGSRGALQVSSWDQGDEAVSTLSWTGIWDRGPQIFCLGSNPHGTYAALHFDFSPPRRGETLGLLGSVPSSGRGVGSGGGGGGWEPGLLGSLPAVPYAPMQSAQQGGCKSLPGVSALLLTQHHKTPAAHQTKGIQDGAATAQAPLGPGEPDELHYAAIDFSKLQRKGAEPPEAPATEYSAVRWK
uniref:Ig-like domain-containing protein n=1 Tax=Chrysemys picta bellii TaxID=8478 RepID=A0A8C3I2G7_CHRPI